MDARQIVRAVKTPVTLVVLGTTVYLAAYWGWNSVTAPIPPRPPQPCVVQEIGPELTPEHVYVQVFNGSETNGLAKRLGSLLSADGFKVIKRINAERSDHLVSEVVGHSEDSPEVVLVSKAFDGIAVRADGRNDHTVDVIIGAEQPVAVEDPDLTVPLPDGTACLPVVEVVDIGG